MASVPIEDITFEVDENHGSTDDRAKLVEALKVLATVPEFRVGLKNTIHDLPDGKVRVVIGALPFVDGNGELVLETAGKVHTQQDAATGVLKGATIYLNPLEIDKSRVKDVNGNWKEMDLFETLSNEVGDIIPLVNQNVPTHNGGGNKLFGVTNDDIYNMAVAEATAQYGTPTQQQIDAIEAGLLKERKDIADHISIYYQNVALKYTAKPGETVLYRAYQEVGDTENGLIGSAPGNKPVFLTTDTITLIVSNTIQVKANPYASVVDTDQDEAPPAPAGGADAFVDRLAKWAKALAEESPAGEMLDNIVKGLVRAKVVDGTEKASPIILDLDGDGIDLIAFDGQNQSFFDLNETGFAVRTGWVAPDDGLLAIDWNGNGRIDSSAELFGSATVDGFTQLRELDSNDDGIINAEDQHWGDLLVWQDLNGNGISEWFELQTLDELGILSIDLNATEVSLTNEGHDITHTSTYTYDTGSGTATRDIVDVWFEHDKSSTRYAQDYTFDLRAAYLIGARGYGTLPDLHISISLDNNEEDADSLLSLVTDFSGLTIEDIFAADTVAMDAVRAVMYRWAGVDGVGPFSRGDHVDAQELEFLEAMTGEPFLQRGYRPNPMFQAAADLGDAFILAHNHYFAMLAAQTEAGALFTGDVYYDIATDSMVGITGLDLDVLDDLETTATGLADTAAREAFWLNVVRMVEYTIGTGNLDGTSLTALEDAITGSDVALDLEDLIDGLTPAANYIDLVGTSGNDVLDGDGGGNRIYGQAGDDTLRGFAGTDELYGGMGDDILIGGPGDDYLSGQGGNDTYVYNLGDGFDTIYDDLSGAGSTEDRILFGTGITLSDLTFTRLGEQDLQIDIDTGTQTGAIVIIGQFHSSGIIEMIEFDDSSTIDLTAQVYTMYGTAGDDVLQGVTTGGSIHDVIYGGDGNDKIYGLSGNDTLYGEDGDDQIFGGAGDDILYGGNGDDLLDGGADDDELHPGAGNDTVKGGSGNDAYYYTSGHDLYIEHSGTDEIFLAPGYTSGSTIYYKINSDLKILFDEDNTITISRFFDSPSYRIETMHFDGGPSVDLTTVGYTLQGGPGDDTLIGTSGDDVFYGMGGNDTLIGGNGHDALYGGPGDDHIEGGNGDDYLDGGSGNDYIYGGWGADTYVYTSGHDAYLEYGSDHDTIQMAPGWTFEDLTFRRYADAPNDLVIEITTANSITLNYYFQSSSRAFETLAFADSSSYSLTTMQYETHGTSGNDTISGITTNGSINDVIFGHDGDDTIYGGTGDDQLFGGNGADSLYGGNGNDFLSGGAGNDYMEGGSGNDTYYFESGLDSIKEHSGTDKIIMGGGVTINDIATAQVGNDAVITVNSGTDELTVQLQHYGSSYRIETIQFEDGFLTSFTDHLSWQWGTSGNDTLTGTSGNDTIIGGDGDDTISGGGGADAIHGGAGNDILRGGDSSDLLHGGLGDDILYGDAGADTLFGGAGADTFMFEAATAYSGIDLVKDFSTGEGDKIDIADVLDGIYDPLSDDLLSFVQVSESGGDTLISIDRDGEGSTYGWTQIATLQGITGLGTAEDMAAAGQLLIAA